MLRYRNIYFKLADITGFLGPFWAADEGTAIALPARAPITAEGYNLVISANILSQLPLPFAHNPPAGDTERRITASLQQAHMDALKSAPCPVLLLSDYQRTVTNTEAQPETEIIPTVAPQLLPGEPDTSWDWTLAPEGELSPSSSTSLQVGSWFMKK